MKHFMVHLVLLMTSTAALANDGPAMTVEEEARALIGVEYIGRWSDKQIAPHLSCTKEGGGLLHDAADTWGDGFAMCQGRAVILLEREVGRIDDAHVKWHIVDTLLLPPAELEWNPKRPDALYLSASAGDQCEIRGRPHIPFGVLARWNKQDKRGRINWRTGVEKAWTFDTKQGRIVPLSTKPIVCESVEP